MRRLAIIPILALLGGCDGFEHDVYAGPRLFEGRWEVVQAFDDSRGEVTDELFEEYASVALDFHRVVDRTGDLVIETEAVNESLNEEREGRWFDEWDLILEDWTLRWVFEVCGSEDDGVACEFWDWTVEYYFLEDGDVLVWTYGRYLNEVLRTDVFTSWDWGTLRLRDP